MLAIEDKKKNNPQPKIMFKKPNRALVINAAADQNVNFTFLPKAKVNGVMNGINPIKEKMNL